MKNICYFIRCRDKLKASPEQTFMLYGEEHEFLPMTDLTQHLSVVLRGWLVEFGHYSYDVENGTVSEVRFDGQEINIDDDGRYYKFEGDDYYVLKGSTEGLVWERIE